MCGPSYRHWAISHCVGGLCPSRRDFGSGGRRFDGEAESGALSGDGLDPKVSTVALDDAATKRKTDAGPRNLAAVEAFEWPENLVLIYGFDADAIVGDGHNDLACRGLFRAHVNVYRA